MSTRQDIFPGSRRFESRVKARSAVRARAASRGAIYVETIVALPIVLYFFFVTWQLFDMFAANLIVRHAADAAARAAAVVGPDDPSYYNGQSVDDLSGGERLQAVTNAALAVLVAHPHLKGTSVSVSVGPITPESLTPFLVTAQVEATYKCYVPWLNAVCGGGSRVLSWTGEFPYQAADVEWTQ
jgi:Flp pilus assembly protein TadG